VTMPSEGDYLMTNRLKSIHRTIPHVQPLLIIFLPTISKIAATQKNKNKNKKTNKLMSLVACHLLKNIIYFVTMPRVHCTERIVKQKNVIYCTNLSSKINYE